MGRRGWLGGGCIGDFGLGDGGVSEGFVGGGFGKSVGVRAWGGLRVLWASWLFLIGSAYKTC